MLADIECERRGGSNVDAIFADVCDETDEPSADDVGAETKTKTATCARSNKPSELEELTQALADLREHHALPLPDFGEGQAGKVLAFDYALGCVTLLARRHGEDTFKEVVEEAWTFKLGHSKVEFHD